MKPLADLRTCTSGLAPSVLADRLESIRLALGTDRLAVARRVPGPADPTTLPLAVLGQVDAAGIVTPPETELPLEFVLDLLTQARELEYRRDTAPPDWAERLRRWGVGWIAGWPLPSDRLPSVFFVAMRAQPRELGPVRREVARAGMEALARVLAPPRWLPLGASPGGPPQPPGAESVPPSITDRADPAVLDGSQALADLLAEVEREILVGALQAAEGNKSLAARKLRVSRQGLYRKLRRHGLLGRKGRALDTDGGDG